MYQQTLAHPHTYTIAHIPTHTALGTFTRSHGLLGCRTLTCITPRTGVSTRLCTTCKIARPVRSKHCKATRVESGWMLPRNFCLHRAIATRQCTHVFRTHTYFVTLPRSAMCACYVSTTIALGSGTALVRTLLVARDQIPNIAR